MKTNPTKFLRAATRISAFCFLSAVAAFAYLFVSLFSAKRLQNRVRQYWARGCAAIIKLKITVKGTPPDAPFFLVSNHLSYVDIIVLMSTLDCVFVAKSDVANWFGLGFLAQIAGTIFIDREKHRTILPVLEKIDEAMKNKTGVVIFPEGTSTKGETVLPFKSSLLEIAARKKLDVNYASLNYSTSEEDAPASLSVCWWGDMTFTDHFWRLCRLKEIKAVITFGDEKIKDENRKELAKKLRAAVNAQFERL